MAIGFFAGLLLGLVHYSIGADARGSSRSRLSITQPVATLFLRLLFMLVVPLMFSALVLGVAGLGDIRALGRIGWKTLAYTVVVSAIAVLIGLVLVNLLQPGDGVDPALAQQLLSQGSERAQAIVSSSAESAEGLDLLLSIVPDNIVKAAAENDILAVMFFALMFGIGLVLTRSAAADTLKRGIEGLYDVTMRLIGLVIRLAPYRCPASCSPSPRSSAATDAAPRARTSAWCCWRSRSTCSSSTRWR